MRLIICLFLLLLTGCGAIGPQPIYSTGDASIQSATDQSLVYRTVHLNGLRSTIYYSSQQEEERQYMIGELRERHPGWRWNDIISGRVSTGMSEQEAMLSWGFPYDINRASYGDQWVYRRGNYSSQYLYFDNGTLTAFNES